MDNKFNIDSSSGTYKTTDKTNHAELKIMDEDWGFIKDKVYSIKFSKFKISVNELLFGALITCIIQYFIEPINERDPNEVFLCILFLGVYNVIKAILFSFPLIKNSLEANSLEVNETHLNDIKNKIKSIEKNNSNL